MSSLRQTIDVVHAFLDLNTMSVVSKSREAQVIGFERFQITEYWTIGRSSIFTRHQQRNAGRIRDHTRRDSTLCQIIERHLFDFASYQATVVERLPGDNVSVRMLFPIGTNLQIDALNLGLEARQAVDAFFKCPKILQGWTAPNLAGYHAQHTGWIR